MPRKKRQMTAELTSMMICIADNLRFHRRRTGYSQQYIADYLSVDRTTYTKYETGVSQMDYEKLAKLANLFNVDFNDLLCYNKIN